MAWRRCLYKPWAIGHKRGVGGMMAWRRCLYKPWAIGHKRRRRRHDGVASKAAFPARSAKQLNINH
ncbi:MAG: hypothetical protein IKZ84_14410 [Victivallales bacterium]|nr:hypothetical protein [Victivallales bacterium]